MHHHTRHQAPWEIALYATGGRLLLLLLLLNAAKQNERLISRDNRGFVLVCVLFLGFLAEGEPLALPSAKQEEVSSSDISIRYHEFPRQEPV